MARLTSAGTTTFIALLMSSTAALADVTPEQVWESWQKQYSAYGFTVTPGSVERDGDVLTISDLVLTNETTTEIGTDKTVSKTVLNVPSILLEDLGDGTVQGTVDGEIDGTNETTDATGKSETAKIKIDKTDASVVISGTPEEMSYLVDAPSVTANIEAQPATPGGKPALLGMTLTGLTGTQSMSSVGGQGTKADLKATGMSLTMTGTDPEDATTINAKIDMKDLAIKGDTMMPEGADAAKLGDAIAKGMHTNSDMSYGALTFTMDSDTKQGPVTVSGSAESGHAIIAFSRDAVRYAATGTKTKVDVQTAEFPMPMSASIDQGEIDFAMPLAATAEPQPFTGKVSLVGLSLSDQIWKMIDPTTKLGHGPATLIIDLTGKGKAMVDLFSPAAAASPVPPVEIDSLDVNKLQLTAAGAELTGAGALTFDNSMGMPMPLGAVDLKLSGANKLMDGLVAMGVMPQDQVMFAKMMMGMYAVPTGDDLFTSKIEFKEGGHILANGQPIK
ncbi:uncharacterized protein DUF2125 [Rhodobacter viridis]|uniref:Uncharacterized protein DUF2125 n=1 Tax=Rhodobacter viridis TaxID=1054202 RepID=A0A318U1Q3_9RHOB|nr:DUF2125 domain-containing protein [Rhodobacter viridis]PYF11890.1 uncharacterized protein DUF2125 [Rhodobacter viridis]